ncbi:MAG: LysM peptidoglycan-binding domain-containing protein [Candidatus Omnitrophota bacterium]
MLFSMEAQSARYSPLTLENVRVSDYPSYTNICLEFSGKYVRGEITPLTASHLMAKLSGVRLGSVDSELSFRSEALSKIVFSSAGNSLIVTIPLKENVNAKEIQWHFWDDILTIDLPLLRPNTSGAPSLGKIESFKQSGGKIVVIDPGHGGFDPGAEGGYAVAAPRMNEKTLVLDMAKRLKKLFDNDPNVNAYLTRNGDYLPIPFGAQGNTRKDLIRESLRYRVELAKEFRGDAYISLHLNAPPPRTSHRSVRGFEIYYLGDDYVDNVHNRDLEDLKTLENDRQWDDNLPAIISSLKRDNVSYNSKVLAIDITEEMKKISGVVLREPSIKPNRYIVLQQPNMPSVLVEMGFITHPVDHEFFAKEMNRDLVVMAIFESIAKKFFHPTEEMSAIVLSEMEKLESKRPASAMTAKADNANTEHRVQSNETLDSIAHKYGTTIAALRNANRGVIGRSNLIHKGDTLRIPTNAKLAESGDRAASAPKSDDEPIVYTVRTGDSLEKIAIRFHTSIDDIKRLNNKKSNSIYPRDKLTIVPGKETVRLAAAKPQRYTVQNGDTLGKIADRYKTSVRSLQQANRIKGTTIHQGQSLIIP